MFEVVFDYGEHDASAPKPNDAREWLCRHDRFSSYRTGLEVRNYPLCQRVLMFHHFGDEQDVGRDSLVRSTDFAYRSFATMRMITNKATQSACSLLPAVGVTTDASLRAAILRITSTT
jgi:hypothetical protein